MAADYARPVFRFAPSPNGALHLGHALSALLNRRRAAETGGRLLVRIEDTDRERSTPELEARILDDLAWLGLEWERPVRRQSEHFDEYRAALDRLIADGFVYPSFMSRGEARALIAEREAKDGERWRYDPDGAPLHPPDERGMPERERRRRIASGEAHAWRLDMTEALRRAPPLAFEELGSGPDGENGILRADPARWGDFVVARRDAPASYMLAVVLDDAAQGVTEVVRGQDLFHATSAQRLLQHLLGLPPPLYRHHRLVIGPDGRKLSKSRGDMALAALRAAGATPDDIRRMVGLA